MNRDFTDRQIGTILNLVRTEARKRGYGEQWTEYNTTKWPVYLAELRTIAEKLHRIRAENDWKDTVSRRVKDWESDNGG